MIDDRLTYGVYTMRLTGPAAALDLLGEDQVDVEGSSVSNLEYAASEVLYRAMGRGFDSLPYAFEFAAPIPSANLYRNIDGSQQWFVGVYAIDRQCGGGEEGGWWFDTGELIQHTAVASHDEAEELREALREEFPETNKRFSVLGGDDYDVYIGITPHPDYFPETRPHYE